jgi:hypothetical protein
MNEKNIGASSVEYLDMFHEYRSMKREGLKTDYIVSRLCEKHKIGRTKFLDLVRCFEAEI